MISKGCALGYRKSARGGNWIARFRDDAGKQHYHALGAADDAMDSDGGALVLSYAEAQRRADDWFKLAARGFEEAVAPTGPYTVKDALTDYATAYKRRGGKAADTMQSSIDALIVPPLGSIALSKLTRRKIENWHEALSTTPARLRTKPGKEQNFREKDETPEGVRRRRSTANRVLTILKAALNHAMADRKTATDEAWRTVKPFREVDAARVRYLNDQEAQRLVNACDKDFRPLVQAALLTGARYGELVVLTVGDFNPDAGTVHIRFSKGGKARHIVLSDEGKSFFADRTAGKTAANRMFARADGDAWGVSHQKRPFADAVKAAKLGKLTFHELRHSYASRLVMAGAPLPVVAAQLGHSDTRMVEKHYGHMSKNYVADTVRAHFGNMGLVQPTNVASMRRAAD
ncbi:phage-related integrase [Aliidongia dinghuensis]|uniref:Phage-related integrase n=1 Tax=Aliidongia dinghuensis TaxID=1867774 RepID=A0A8J2YVT1_9PROT|nr:phage-related integrase [Aliidongia dinghuensis]